MMELAAIISKPVMDFRFLDEGMGGQANKKRRRSEDEEEDADVVAHPAEMAIDDDASNTQAAKRQAVSMADEDRPRVGRPSYDGSFAGKVSGRKWKMQKTRRTSSLRVTGRKEASLEEKNKERELKKAYKERKEELKEQIRSNKQAKRQRIAEKRRMKEENALKGAVLERITNASTIKKMSKKQRQSLVKM